MVESSIVATAQENLPWLLSFAVLVWHMPLDVLLGWYFVFKWLYEKTRLQLAGPKSRHEWNINGP